MLTPMNRAGGLPANPELLRKTTEWQALMESGKVATQSDIACQEGITRARVTHVLGLQRLATERVLRPIATITDHKDRIREFHKLSGSQLTQIRDVP